MASRMQRKWAKFWLRFGSLSPIGRFAMRVSAWMAPPYKGRGYLARLHPGGFIAPSAIIHHNDLDFGENIFIGDRVIIYQARNGGSVSIGRGSKIHLGTIIETGAKGKLDIGRDTHIQPRCQFSAYVGSIAIGNGVQIAPYCAFYPYDHQFAANQPIKGQPLRSDGDISVGDDVLLGVGVTVLNDVRIGKGAVVGAGAVVTKDIPDSAVAIGTPAKVIKMRE